MLREGYGFPGLRADALAGLTVAIVALPLSMAIAVASSATPQAGLVASVVGGFLVSALGGSRVQIGGPAGAFIVLVATTIETHGYAGFLAATIMAGTLLVAIGYLRLGTYIKYIPHSVVVGFTASIAVIIFASQLHELFGPRLAREPAALLPKVDALWAARATFNPAAIGTACLCLAIVLAMRIIAPRWPGLLVAIGAAAAATWALGLPIETIGTRFGGIPRALPVPALPPRRSPASTHPIWVKRFVQAVAIYSRSA